MAASPADVARAALAARVRDPGYTPGIRDLGPLLGLFGEEDEDLARATERGRPTRSASIGGRRHDPLGLHRFFVARNRRPSPRVLFFEERR